ncbi:uncharacterized protein LOC122672078 [Telopea speciosissima]|uniref:uncharacterized protein LOC122672078 n=1 Tax=Telopea speciosissima TaxID=54955 RepID=UPI001CC6CB79|nr:uncharacterized protein LOC122672078 [Telopea speciosissima]
MTDSSHTSLGSGSGNLSRPVDNHFSGYLTVDTLISSLVDDWGLIQLFKDVGAAADCSLKVAGTAGDRVRKTTQWELSVSACYSAITTLWQQLDFYHPVPMICTSDAATFAKEHEMKQVYDFLTSLNSEYDQIRIQVLSKGTFPMLLEAYNMIYHEDHHRSVMMPPTVPTRSALVTTPHPSLSVDIAGAVTKTVFIRELVKCDYCVRPRHNRETYWKLHGLPKGGGHGGKSGSSCP